MAFFEFFTSETNVQPVNPEYNMADFNKISVDWKIYSKPCFSLPWNIMKNRDFHTTEWNKRQASYGEHVATYTTIYKSKYVFPQTNPNPMKTENWMFIKKKRSKPRRSSACDSLRHGVVYGCGEKRCLYAHDPYPWSDHQPTGLFELFQLDKYNHY